MQLIAVVTSGQLIVCGASDNRGPELTYSLIIDSRTQSTGGKDIHIQ